jgi:hypothetical protein
VVVDCARGLGSAFPKGVDSAVGLAFAAGADSVETADSVAEVSRAAVDWAVGVDSAGGLGSAFAKGVDSAVGLAFAAGADSVEAADSVAEVSKAAVDWAVGVDSAGGLGSAAGADFAVEPNSAEEVDSVEAVPFALGVVDLASLVSSAGGLICAEGLDSTNGVDSANGVGSVEIFDSPEAGNDGVSKGAPGGLGLISADRFGSPSNMADSPPFSLGFGLAAGAGCSAVAGVFPGVGLFSDATHKPKRE